MNRLSAIPKNLEFVPQLSLFKNSIRSFSREKSTIDYVDNVIIGAGVVGLACAAQLSSKKKTTFIFEAENSFGSHTSSRNSEVVHAGIYYDPTSLKAQLCIEGRERLYHWCESNNVPFHKIGKLLVAVDRAEESSLESLQKNAQKSGYNNLIPLDKAQIGRLEPHVRAYSGLLSPETGIVDTHSFMESLLTHAAKVSDGQTTLVCRTVVTHIFFDYFKSAWRITGFSGGNMFELYAGTVINAAGLGAQAIATTTYGYPLDSIPPLILCQGRYMDYTGKSPFERLIYPMPEANATGLGVHGTLDMGGRLRFGPDTLFLGSAKHDRTTQTTMHSSVKPRDIRSNASPKDLSSTSSPGENYYKHVNTDIFVPFPVTLSDDLKNAQATLDAGKGQRESTKNKKQTLVKQLHEQDAYKFSTGLITDIHDHPAVLQSNESHPGDFLPAPIRRQWLYGMDTQPETNNNNNNNGYYQDFARNDEKNEGDSQNVEETLRRSFSSAISRYFPLVDSSKLKPGTIGVRPKLHGPGQKAADFKIAGPLDHGLPQYVSLFGIESPGLTSSLAIAAHVEKLLKA